MIKLSELVDKEFQPSEISRMKNFLKRGSKDHPEDHNMSNSQNKGFPWSFDDPSGIYESGELNKIHQSLIGREFQTLQDLAKITSRLRQRGFVQSDIDEFLRTYII